MKTISTELKKYSGENPFGDFQSRNISDYKVRSEFYPTSTFWSLFNDQHEILIGSRGSGKTVLLKMMKNSMLKSIDDERARRILLEKHFISLYIPLHLEFVASIITSDLDITQQIRLFQAAFNCLLAQSLVSELKALIFDQNNSDKESIILAARISKTISEMWFNENNPIFDLQELSQKIDKVFYSINENTGDISNVPVIFQKQICSPLLAVKDRIAQLINYNDPTWIICIDEAEFLNEPLLRCINSFFRSDSNRIAIKMATLPFYHYTHETLKDNTYVSDGNDFNYRLIDMKYDSDDFLEVTNKICSKRLSQTIDISDSNGDILESFLGKVGNDDQIDYYKKEMKQDFTYDQIYEGIISSFSKKKQNSIKTYTNTRKTIYDKYAPIYFLREMYKRTQNGNSKPGWYAGAKTVRRVTQGNPRMFIHLMNDLFYKATVTALTAKAQHEVIYKFSNNITVSTKSIEGKGPTIYKEITRIAEILKSKTHNGFLTTSSSSFELNYIDEEDFKNNIDWIKLAIAHSRLFVDEDVKKGNLTMNTKLCLANVFSVVYWLPMRKDSPTKIRSFDKVDNSYMVCVEGDQLTLFGDDSDA